jgi:DNA-binding NarL/FixJ family response regulator
MNNPIRILVADDHPVVREGLVAMLRTQPDFEVIGEAATGAEAVRGVAALAPDVVLLDLEMPEVDGVEVLRRLRDAGSDVAVIVLTAFDTDERILGAVRAGARGYLLKGAPRDQIFSAIRVVNVGGSLLQPLVAAKVLRHLSDGGHRTPPRTTSPTDREHEVLRWMARGKSNKEIARALGISERTVKFHVGSILDKLGAENRTDAVRIAAREGLITL